MTAVGDPSPAPFELRLSGLLRRLERSRDDLADLYVVGGQCNYLFRSPPAQGDSWRMHAPALLATPTTGSGKDLGTQTVFLDQIQEYRPEHEYIAYGIHTNYSVLQS